MSDKRVSDKHVSDKRVSDKSVSNRPVSDKHVSDKHINDKHVSNKLVSDKRHILACFTIYSLEMLIATFRLLTASVQHSTMSTGFGFGRLL